MRSDEIDLAFYCAHMALHLTEEDRRFTIYAPVIMNAEVLISAKPPETIDRIGIGQQRGHLRTLALETYPNITKVLELSPRVLPYALTEGKIDGAVIDISKASLVPQYQVSPISNDDYISYVLVIRKDLIGTDIFKRFLGAYQLAIEELRSSAKFDEVVFLELDN